MRPQAQPNTLTQLAQPAEMQLAYQESGRMVVASCDLPGGFLTWNEHKLAILALHEKILSSQFAFRR